MGITQEHEYQEAGIIGCHLRSCLLHSPIVYFSCSGQRDSLKHESAFHASIPNLPGVSYLTHTRLQILHHGLAPSACHLKPLSLTHAGPDVLTPFCFLKLTQRCPISGFLHCDLLCLELFCSRYITLASLNSGFCSCVIFLERPFWTMLSKTAIPLLLSALYLSLFLLSILLFNHIKYYIPHFIVCF